MTRRRVATFERTGICQVVFDTHNRPLTNQQRDQLTGVALLADVPIGVVLPLKLLKHLHRVMQADHVLFHEIVGSIDWEGIS